MAIIMSNADNSEMYPFVKFIWTEFQVNKVTCKDIT